MDAVSVRKQERVAALKRDLLGEDFEKLARRCLDDIAVDLRRRSLEEYRRALETDALPVLGKIPPTEIERSHIRTLVERIAKRAPVQANRTLASIRRVFSRAVEKDLLPVSPCAGIKAPTQERVRERVYSNDEVRAILTAVVGTELEDLVALIFHTATRSEETRAARWLDIDFERRLWTIPGDVAKNRESHSMPLSSGALRILQKCRLAVPQDCPWAFPAKQSARGFLPSPGHEAIKELRRRSGVRDVRLHDIRRTLATRLAEAGTSVAVVEAVLGHRPAKLVRTYQKHGFIPEMAAALETWSTSLARVLAGKEGEGAAIVQFGRH